MSIRAMYPESNKDLMLSSTRRFSSINTKETYWQLM